MATQVENIKITIRQREGRAINAVAELLRSKLSVPNIYLNPPKTLISADLLAVDRAGAGDLHAVEIKLFPKLPAPIGPKTSTLLSLQLEVIHHALMEMPTHFRYLAVPLDFHLVVWKSLSKLGFFSTDGIGKIGIITIQENGSSQPIADLAIPAERFRVDPEKLKTIETKFLDKQRPDIEVRI